MQVGFAHFDSAHRENFCAALILLVLDTDEIFRTTFTNFMRERAGLKCDSVLTEWRREEPLDISSECKRRSDIRLQFEDGLVLVEIKTHSQWNSDSVAQQLRDQRNAKDVREVILLAPSALLRHCRNIDFPMVSWHEFFDAIEAIQDPGAILSLAHEHWSIYVERDFGLPSGTSVLPFEATAAQIGCLVAFLRAAICRLGGKLRGSTVYFSSPDGRPQKRSQWAWFGTVVPARIPDLGEAFLGIYSYTSAPPGEALGTFLEAYLKWNDDEPLVSIPVNLKDLSPDALESVLEEFLGEYENAVAHK